MTALVADSDNVIALNIGHADARMMIRELVQNCLEATACIAEDDVIIEMRRDEDDKLVFFNNGTGMASDELVDTMRQVFKSGGNKVNAVDANYGQGCRVTILANYHSDGPSALYRSCKDRMVSEVQLGWADGIPQLLDWEDGNPVRDATQEWAAESLTYDWTEVVLLGDMVDHATADYPFSVNEPIPTSGLAKMINHRFYRLRGGLKDCTESGFDYWVRGLRAMAYDEVSEVKLPHVTIRYGLMEDKVYRGREQRGGNNHAALIYENECIGLFDGSWSIAATRFGFPLIGKRVCVEVMVDELQNIQWDNQRKNLYQKQTDGSLKQLTVDEFEDDIRDNIPEWLQREIDAAQQDATVDRSQDLNKALDKLAEEYSQSITNIGSGMVGGTKPKKARSKVCPKCGFLECICPRCGGCGRKQRYCVCGKPPPLPRGPHKGCKTKLGENPEGEGSLGEFVRPPKLPEYVWLEATESQYETSFRGPTFLASLEGNYLYLNATFPSLAELVEVLGKGKSSTTRQMILNYVKEYITLETLRMVLNANVLQGDNWGEKEMESATSKSAITAAIGDSRRLLNGCTAQILKRIRGAK